MVLLTYSWLMPCCLAQRRCWSQPKPTSGGCCARQNASIHQDRITPLGTPRAAFVPTPRPQPNSHDWVVSGQDSRFAEEGYPQGCRACLGCGEPRPPLVGVLRALVLFACPLSGRAGVHYTELQFQHLDPTKLPPVRLVRELGKFYLSVYPLFRRAMTS